MTISKASESEVALVRLKKTARIISVGFRVGLIVYCLIWIALAGFFAVLAFSPGAVSDSAAIGFRPLILCLVFGFLIAVLLRIATLVFDDVSKGESPFSKRQVKRIRWASFIFLAYAVVEMFFPQGHSSLVQDSDLYVGYWISSNSTGSAPMSINLGMLGAAIIFYCLSLVFEYGTLLQQLSDETL